MARALVGRDQLAKLVVSVYIVSDMRV